MRWWRRRPCWRSGSRLDGRWRGSGVLATTLGLGTLAYTVASVLANGSSEPSRVLAWAMTYAHRGHWWSLDLGRNLLLDAVRCATFSWRNRRFCRRRCTGWRRAAFLLAGSLALGNRWRCRLGDPLSGASGRKLDPRGRGIRRSRYWFTPRRPASFGAPMGSLWTRARLPHRPVGACRPARL